MLSLTLKLEKVIFLFEHPIELDTEDQVMKRNTNRVMKYDLILQGAMSLMHRRKSGMGDREAFLVQRFSCPYCYTINAFFIVSCAPSIINLEMRFLLRGRAITPRVMTTLITVITTLTMHQIYGLIKLKLKYRTFNFISTQNIHDQVRNS
jgi:hypothetical protein